MSKSQLVINMTKAVGKILKEISLVAGHLLIALILIVGRKIRAEGKPGAAQLASWLRERSNAFTRRSIAAAKPMIIETGQILRALVIIAGARLRKEGGPKVLSIAHVLKQRSIAFISKSKEIIAQQTDKAFRESGYEKHIDENLLKNSSANDISIAELGATIPTQFILEKDYTLDISERYARGIKDNGIICQVIRDLESIQIEKKSCYSYLFPMSPIIVTSRGYIGFEDSNRGNISLIQIIQKN